MNFTQIKNWIERGKDPSFALQIIQLIRFSAVFIVSVLLVKAGVTTTTIGSYEYVLYFSSILTGVWTNGVFQSFLLQSGELNGDELKILFRKYSIAVLSILFLLFLMVWSGETILTGYLGFSDFPEGFYYFLIFHLVFNGSYILVFKYFVQRRILKMYFFGLSFFIVYILTFSLLLIEGVLLVQIFQILSLVGFLYLFVWGKEWFSRGEKGLQQKINIHFGGFTTLITIQAIAALSVWSDSWWVQFFYGNGDVFAFFRYGAREFPLFIILSSAFGTAMIGYLSSDRQEGLSRIRLGSKRLIYSFAVLYLILIVVSKPLYQFFYSADFVQSSVIFDLYLTIVAVRVVFPRTVLIGHKFYRSLIGISLLELLMNLILSYYLHTIFGILGLVLATVIAHLAEMVIITVYLHFKKQVKWGLYVPVKVFMGFVVFVLAVFYIKYQIVGFENLLLDFD